jgi:hypothetical protein
MYLYEKLTRNRGRALAIDRIFTNILRLIMMWKSDEQKNHPTGFKNPIITVSQLPVLHSCFFRCITVDHPPHINQYRFIIH